MKDWRGTEIEVGDTILYSVKHSTSVEVNEAIVSEVGMKPKYAWLSDFGDVKPEDMVPYVAVEWQKSSEYYSPVRGRVFDNQRKVRRYVLTNFEVITVVAKHKVPAWDILPMPVYWERGY